MDKTGTFFVLGWLALSLALIGVGLWIGTNLGALVFLIGLFTLLMWLFMMFKLLRRMGSGMP